MGHKSPREADVELLLRQLDVVEKPRGISAAWDHVQQSDANSTAKIFLDHGGTPAWLAYHLAKQNIIKAAHISGKAACKRLIDAIENETIESRKFLAVEVASALNTKTQKQYARWREKIARFRKRIKDDSACMFTPSF